MAFCSYVVLCCAFVVVRGGLLGGGCASLFVLLLVVLRFVLFAGLVGSLGCLLCLSWFISCSTEHLLPSARPALQVALQVVSVMLDSTLAGVHTLYIVVAVLLVVAVIGQAEVFLQKPVCAAEGLYRDDQSLAGS